MSRVEAYGYAIARIHSMGVRLIDERVYNRLLEAPDFAACYKILGETAYAPWLNEAGERTDFEQVLVQELADIFTQVKRFVPDPQLVTLFQLPYDVHNLKVAFKSTILQKQGKERRWDLLSSLGSIETDTIISAVETDNFDQLPYGFDDAMRDCKSTWEQHHEMLWVECELDAAMYKIMGAFVSRLAYPGVISWYKSRVDAENLRSLMRLKRFGVEQGSIYGFLLDGGVISQPVLSAMYAETPESWSRLLGYADASAMMAKLEEPRNYELSVETLDRLLDEFLTFVIDRYANQPFAPEEVIRFLWQKEIETKNLRIVLVAKKNQMNTDKAWELLRNVS
ncbi:MAG: V-type ATPase subunit [Synergistales bacterium]|nr:V-type ATPase subunit [Synergistales bacterium]